MGRALTTRPPEGSTRLLHALGADAYAEALAMHRRQLRDAFARHGGVEVDTQGDAFFVAFPTAPGALAAARQGLVRPRTRSPMDRSASASACTPAPRC
jgi:class 3 adenylate cyclase